MKIELFAKTIKGQAGYTLTNPKQAIEQISPLAGFLKITIETIEHDATDSQKHYFLKIVVPALIDEANQTGATLNETTAIDLLLQQFADGKKLDELGIGETSKLIDESKAWIRDFFNTKII